MKYIVNTFENLSLAMKAVLSHQEAYSISAAPDSGLSERGAYSKSQMKRKEVIAFTCFTPFSSAIYFKLAGRLLSKANSGPLCMLQPGTDFTSLPNNDIILRTETNDIFNIHFEEL